MSNQLQSIYIQSYLKLQNYNNGKADQLWTLLNQATLKILEDLYPSQFLIYCTMHASYYGIFSWPILGWIMMLKTVWFKNFIIFKPNYFRTLIRQNNIWTWKAAKPFNVQPGTYCGTLMISQRNQLAQRRLNIQCQSSDLYSSSKDLECQ